MGPPGEPINSYALVSYTPAGLAEFLDGLRSELVSGCTARSHVTVLPPRELKAGSDVAIAELRAGLQEFGPFEVELTDVEVFESTSVIYIGIGRGQERLEKLHDSLNSRSLWFDEPYVFHPHVTLAQGIAPGEVSGLAEVARRQWRDFGAPRTYTVDTLSFVQNTSRNLWLDLLEIPLVEPAVVRC